MFADDANLSERLELMRTVKHSSRTWTRYGNGVADGKGNLISRDSVMESEKHITLLVVKPDKVVLVWS